MQACVSGTSPFLRAHMVYAPSTQLLPAAAASATDSLNLPN